MKLNMKTLKVSDTAHRELVRLLGQMMAQTKKQVTFNDVVEAVVSKAGPLPPELVLRIDRLIEARKELGYTSRDEFVREAVAEALSKHLTSTKSRKRRARKEEKRALF